MAAERCGGGPGMGAVRRACLQRASQGDLLLGKVAAWWRVQGTVLKQYRGQGKVVTKTHLVLQDLQPVAVPLARASRAQPVDHAAHGAAALGPGQLRALCRGCVEGGSWQLLILSSQAAVWAPR